MCIYLSLYLYIYIYIYIYIYRCIAWLKSRLRKRRLTDSSNPSRSNNIPNLN